MYGADDTDRAAMTQIYMGGELVQCRLCKSPRGLSGTKLCDRCWELDGRIRADPWLAREILQQLDQEQAQQLKQKLQEKDYES